ncbi:MAG TPA: CocE/NonD family hydrolase [Solirubrobacterales bacterium]|nr:CocE/NonD family hydrolase [Solirubrobacterales bacterium]
MGGAFRRPGRRTAGSSAFVSVLLLLFLIPTGAGATGAAPAFEARGSVDQVYATGVAPGAKVALFAPDGSLVQSKNADELGGVLFREVTPGSGYRLRVGSGRQAERSEPLTVLTQRSAPPDTSIYEQKIAPHGYQYLTTRDGTKLAIDVHPPQDVAKVFTGMIPEPGEGSGGTPELPQLPRAELEEKLKEIPGVGKEIEGLSELLAPVTESLGAVGSGGQTATASAAELPYVSTGPTPTLIEYSGYGYADPAGPENGISLIANLLGFTVVDVNMRGTGCSGGAYDFFEPLQNLDGYDVIETIAHQPWVLHHEVGMMGISYGGISQLFTAATRPPDLSAITPLSVIDNTQTTLYPGGILNTGFALEWAKERVHDAEAAGPTNGQAWAYKRIQEGDETCKADQVLHPEAVDLLKKIEENSHYVPKVADPLSPVTFVHKIDVPTFMACQWTDEQTGGHCPDLAEHFTGTRKKWFTFTNGAHIDSLDPQTFNRWVDFLELYVAKQSPAVAGAVAHVAAPLIFEEAMGIKGLTLPPDPVQLLPTYEVALAAFEAEKPIRVMFDNGAGGTEPGQPYPTFEESFDEFPIPGTQAKAWYLAPGGSLAARRPAGAHADKFTWDADALPLQDFSGDTGSGEGGLWTQTPSYHWEQNPPGTAVSYLTEPLAEDTTVIGAGAVNLWVRSSTPNVDLQATVSEVRPDGKETFVQNGWVRADERKLDAKKSTPLEPVLSLRESDVEPMPADEFVKVTIPLYYEGHAYRAGSRIRVTIAAPNGTQPIWGFEETEPQGKATVAIAYSKEDPSDLLLPVVPGVAVPSALPPCPGLRGEPCREYVPFANRSAKP